MKVRLMKTHCCIALFLFAVSGLMPTSLGFAQGTTSQTGEPARTNGDAVYQQIRRKGSGPEDFNGAVATVSGLTLQRDAVTFKFNSGEIYFLTPVEGRVVGAVFIGDVEMIIVPPTEAEKRSLALFTGSREAPDHFTRLVMRFSDKTFEEIKNAPGVQMKESGAQAAKARDAYREIQNMMRKDV